MKWNNNGIVEFLQHIGNAERIHQQIKTIE